MVKRKMTVASIMRVMAVMALCSTALMYTAQAVAECCSTCIGKVSQTVYDYDPLVYAQCSNKTGGSRVCCFECGTMGEPEFGDTVSYASDGTTATVKAGTYIKMDWSEVDKVTYISLKDGQKKTVTPTISNTAAEISSSSFLICAKSVGTIYFRGWGNDTCREASLEQSVTVLEGEEGASCDDTDDKDTKSTDDTATSASAGSSSANTAVTECNMNRASIKTVDGVETCVCVSDWSNPPACDQMPAWKWAFTIGGGVAALFSIIISVRAFMKSREKKRQQEDEDKFPMPPPIKEDVETLQITPDQKSHEVVVAAPYNQNFHQATQHNNPVYLSPPADQNFPVARPAAKTDEREFTL